MGILIWDLETLAMDDATILANAPAWDIEEAKTRVPKNYRQESAINGWLEEDERNYTKNLLEKAALNPETATVAVFGVMNNIDVIQWKQDDGVSERVVVSCAMDILKSSIGHGVSVGWNILGFDLPFLLKRAWILGIKVPSSIYSPLSRYPVSEKFVDMMKVWQAGNYRAPYTSLNNAMKAVGLPGKPDGSEFAKLWTKDKAEALGYNANEIRGQCELYRRMGVNL